jgi:hypothetical protein
LVNHALLPFFCCFIYCVIKCVKSTRVLKGKFASSVFQSWKEKTPKTRKLVSGPQCVKPYSVISRFNLCAAFCRLSSVSAVITWSSANNSIDRCWFFESLIPVISCFCHLVIISSNYILTHSLPKSTIVDLIIHA